MPTITSRGQSILIEGTSSYAAKIKDADVAHVTHALDRISRGGVCLDIGANVGATALVMAQYASRVVAFEPHPKTADQLQKNIRLNGAEDKIAIHMFGLGAQAGRISFRDVDEFNSGNSGMVSGSVYEKAYPSIDVEIRTLDSFEIAEEIDLIKIDVEGFETDVLEGGAATIRRTQAALIEFNHWTLSMCRRILPDDALSRIFETFKYVHSFESGKFVPVVTDKDRLSFLSRNMLRVHVSDLLCTNSSSISEAVVA